MTDQRVKWGWHGLAMILLVILVFVIPWAMVVFR